MQHKADLTHTVQAFQVAKQTQESYLKDITNQSAQLIDIVQQITVMRSQIAAQKNEIKERKDTINEKDARILDLKKKT